MRKKTSPTILEQAILLVPEFENVLKKLDQQVALRGQSKSTLANYGRRIALFVIHFQCLPHQVCDDLLHGQKLSGWGSVYTGNLNRSRVTPTVLPSCDARTVCEDQEVWFLQSYYEKKTGPPVFTEAQQASQKIEKKIESRKERIRRLTGIDVCKCPS